MLLLDRILLSPMYGTIWIARQVHHAIEQEQAAEPARITAELSELYMMLETGRISEAEFDAREKVLLDQLDQVQEQAAGPQEEAKHQERAGSAPLAGGKKPRLKTAVIALLPLLLWLPGASAEGDSHVALGSGRWSPQRPVAQAMIETGCASEQACRADRLVDPPGAVCRFQILPGVWRKHLQSSTGAVRPTKYSHCNSYGNPVPSKGTVERIMEARAARLVGATGRAPNDFGWYVPGHKPGAFVRAGYQVHRLSPLAQDRAQRFSILVTSEARRAGASGP